MKGFDRFIHFPIQLVEEHQDLVGRVAVEIGQVEVQCRFCIPGRLLEKISGAELGVDMHVVTADEAPLSNLELTINRCHLGVETVVATPYAAGLAAIVDDEAELGVACFDMGGGTTSLSVFHEGRFVFADSAPIGGFAA